MANVSRWGMALGGAVALAVVASPVGAAPVRTPRPISVLSQPVRHVTVNHASIGYRIAGSGEPLILISGSGMTMAEWQPSLLDALARRHRVIVFDNRGTGTSTGSVANLSIKRMAADTSSLIARLAGGRSDVLGWSMGGYVAQKLTVTAPKRVRRLGLASTDCGGPTTLPPKPWVLKILTDPDATQAQRLSVLFPPDQAASGQAWMSEVGAAFGRNGYQPSDSFDVRAGTVSAQSKAAGNRWLGTGKGICRGLTQVAQPVLVAAGLDDVVVPARNRRALLRRLPDAKGLAYEDAGHAFLFQPELAFSTAVDRFLRERG
jgi:pimeloyl-ACP methyl ester carboxylesterase